MKAILYRLIANVSGIVQAVAEMFLAGYGGQQPHPKERNVINKKEK